jgi:peroxiredoxin
MKKLTFLLLLLVAGGLNLAHGQLPGVKIENAAGETINTSVFAAKKTPLIVSFWSTTCKPCIVELNAMNDLVDEWRDEAEFEVLAICTDDSRSASYAKSMAAGNGWDRFTILYDKNQEFKRALNVNLIPHTFIFDGEGKIVYSHVGYTPGTEEEYIQVIKSIK